MGAQVTSNGQTSYTYTFTITNYGPDTATGVELSHFLPTGVAWLDVADSRCATDLTKTIVTCTLGTLAVAATDVISYQVSAQDRGDLTVNPITVSGNETDTILSNNTTAPTSGTDETPVILITPQGGGGGSAGGGGGGGALGPLGTLIPLLWCIYSAVRRLRVHPGARGGMLPHMCEL